MSSAEILAAERSPDRSRRAAVARADIRATSRSARRAKQIGRKGGRIDDAAAKRFGECLRTEITGANTELRHAYLRIFVSEVVVNENEILVAWAKAALEAGAHKGKTG